MEDLTDILNAWPYDPGQAMRIIVAQDGRRVLQVRQPLGIEQYELEGRPDGVRPYGFETVLNHVQDRLRRHIVETGSEAGFQITLEEASELQAEGVLFYYRYLLLFQLHYYEMVVRDTTHNLDLCDLVERYCENEDARTGVLQFRPYILRMHAAARAIGIANGAIEGDFQSVLDEAVAHIESLGEIDTPAFQFERIRSVNYLRALQRKLTRHSDTDTDADETATDTDGSASEPTDDRSRLEQELQDAVDTEDYERAAQIRDALRRRG